MASPDSILHLIGGEILLMLWVVIRLQDNSRHRRSLSAAFTLILGFMAAHLLSHVLPERVANFIHGTHREYRSFHRQG